MEPASLTTWVQPLQLRSQSIQSVWKCQVLVRILQTFKNLNLLFIGQMIKSQFEKCLAQNESNISVGVHVGSSLTKVKDTHLMHNNQPVAEILCWRLGRRWQMWCSCKRLCTGLGCIRRNPGMVRAVTLAVWKQLRKCVTLMYWSCLCDVTRGRPDHGLSLPLPVVWKRLQRELMVFRCTPTSHWGVPAWIISMAGWRASVPKRGTLSLRTDNDHQ